MLQRSGKMNPLGKKLGTVDPWNNGLKDTNSLLPIPMSYQNLDAQVPYSHPSTSVGSTYDVSLVEFKITYDRKII